MDSNMAGICNKAQAQILEKKPFALYVPCGAYGLNLAGVYAVESCSEIKTFFDNTQALYLFFRCCPVRWKILQEETA